MKREILAAEKLAASKQEKPTQSAAPTRYTSELTNYAFDQSEKFVKLFVTLDGIEKIQNPDTNVTITFTERSLELKIVDFNNRDYKFVVNNLLEPIVVEKSYRKVKSDMIAIYLKKATEGKNWAELTVTAKQLKDLKASAFKEDNAAESDDPSAGIMNMMKKLYESGDPEMKRMIAKTWQENADKRMQNPSDLMPGAGGMGGFGGGMPGL